MVFQKLGLRGRKRNHTVSCQDIRLYVLNVHAKIYSHSVFICPLKLWISTVHVHSIKCRPVS